MIQIAVLGYGTVGSGVVEVINRNQESINKKQEKRSTSSMYLTHQISREIRYRKRLFMITK